MQEYRSSYFMWPNQLSLLRQGTQKVIRDLRFEDSAQTNGTSLTEIADSPMAILARFVGICVLVARCSRHRSDHVNIPLLSHNILKQ